MEGQTPKETIMNCKQQLDETRQRVMDMTERINKEKIAMIVRLTTYTYEEAETKLKDCNSNYEMVISEFMGIKKKPVSTKSVNQEVFTQIRKRMDEASSSFYSN